MKKIAILLAVIGFCFTAAAQDDDWYRPGGFDATGCSKKLFSVSETKKVHFSRGNLQYNAAQDKWRFALRQYSYSCNDNASIAQDYDGWIDLFGWGTSGWNSGATAYQPWSRSSTVSDYYPGAANTNNLTGDYANADWGVYNKISNGGNKAGMWRTLTKEEWEYLLGSSAERSGKFGFATIEGIYKGLVILPDEWVLPNGVSFTSGEGDNGYATNSYTLNEWQKMEAAGALFMPTAGSRNGSSLSNVGTSGRYWSSSYYGSSSAYFMGFSSGSVGINGNGRFYGYSVRLVRNSRESRGLAFDENGASYKRFSVSDTSTVRFSKGNLQYNAAQNVWRFAAKQYMYIGDGNANTAQNYNGWIDLFGWGTSGWNSGATAYQPWSTSSTASDYYPGGYDTVSLTGDYANADWGVYNRISNGGNKAGMWRVLTNEEINYLRGNSTKRNGKCALATIDGIYPGLVILPDDWTLPRGVQFTSGCDNGFTTNIYSMVQWQRMESAGAIFLPASGFRSGLEMLYVGERSRYWTSTDCNSSAYVIFFYSDSFSSENWESARYIAGSVRLVKD